MPLSILFILQNTFMILKWKVFCSPLSVECWKRQKELPANFQDSMYNRVLTTASFSLYQNSNPAVNNFLRVYISLRSVLELFKQIVDRSVALECRRTAQKHHIWKRQLRTVVALSILTRETYKLVLYNRWIFLHPLIPNNQQFMFIIKTPKTGSETISKTPILRRPRVSNHSLLFASNN